MISVIMSAYNAEKTIAKSIKSILNQSYKDLELIIINDASTDKTLDVISSFNDDRIKVTTLETNQGAGNARNLGTKIAKGEYTSFVDSDDYISTDYIETLYNVAVEYNADMVSSGIISIDTTGKEIGRVSQEFTILNDKECITKVTSKITETWLNNSLIKRELWNKVEYSKRRFIEDTPTCFMLSFFAKKRIIIPYCGYYYVQLESSLIHSASQEKSAIYRILATIDIIKFLRNQNVNAGTQVFLTRLKELQINNRELYKDELSEILEFLLTILKF